MLIDHYNSIELERLSTHEDQIVRRLVLELRVVSQDYLLARVYELARKYLDDLYGVDIALWKVLEEGPTVMSEEEITDLGKLQQLAGGWWDFTNTLEPSFVSTAEWKEIYNARLRGG